MEICGSVIFLIGFMVAIWSLRGPRPDKSIMDILVYDDVKDYLRKEREQNTKPNPYTVARLEEEEKFQRYHREKQARIARRENGHK